MLFSSILWFKPYIKKMDKPLKKELFRSFRHSKLIPSFTHNLMNKISFCFKKYSVIVKLLDNIDQNSKDAIYRIMGSGQQGNNKKLTSVNSYYGRFTQKKLMKLLQHRNVKMIYLDRECKALLDVASTTLNAPFSWNMDITGKGITTAVIDTGIYPHNDLIKPVNRILAFKDFVKKKKQPYDDNGHGTHVAGNIASSGLSSNGLYKAPAFNSCLVGVKVLDKKGSGSYSRIISGLEWCIENKNIYGIRIICMSLGSDAADSYRDDLICEAVEAVWKSGIVVCAAAGNEGPKYKSIASPGIDPIIITVGASDDRNTSDTEEDIVADFSSRGPTVDGLEKPDLLCPGKNIISLRSPRSRLDKNLKENRVGRHYISLSGTSMATPLCCSVVALLLEKNPGFTPDQVKAALVKACTDMGYDKNTQGNGCINIMKLPESGCISEKAENDVQTSQPDDSILDMFDVLPGYTFVENNIGQQEENTSQPDNTTSDAYDNMPENPLKISSSEHDINTQSDSPETSSDVPASQQQTDIKDTLDNQAIQFAAEHPENQPVQQTDITSVTPSEKNKCSPGIGLWITSDD